MSPDGTCFESRRLLQGVIASVDFSATGSLPLHPCWPVNDMTTTTSKNLADSLLILFSRPSFGHHKGCGHMNFFVKCQQQGQGEDIIQGMDV